MTDSAGVTTTTNEDLFVQQRSSAITLAAMILGSRDDAEDVVQDCFVTLTDRSMDGIDDPPAYLRRMIVNRAYAIARRRRRETPAAFFNDPGTTDSTIVEFADAIRVLTPKRRAVVVLRYFCDLPVKEIAELLDLRPSSVSSLLNRAMTDLREVLHEH